MFRVILYFSAILILFACPIHAQDSTWQQVLGGWVDDVYYENLFLGGAYYTRISLADIDGDGDLDMFYGGGDCGSLVYFENIGTPQEYNFKLRYEEFPSLQNEPHLYGGTVDVDFADLDNDGDLDAAYSAEIDVGGSIAWNDGSAEEPIFVFRQPYGPGASQSNVTLIDIDNDGDFDYFSGEGYRGEQLYYAENAGTPDNPDFEIRTYHYQNLDFGAPFNFDFGDLDNDGDYDLLVCKTGGTISYYENIGIPDDAQFVLRTNDYLPDREFVDWTETPEFADIDDDGDLDLFLAGGYAHLFLFENVGDAEDPQFIQRSDTSYFYIFPQMGGALLGNSVDIDNDGDDDLAPGITLLLNESVDGQIRFTQVDDVLPFVLGAFADIDADGDYDYIIPAGENALGYYENIGNPSWPVWDSFRVLFPPDGRLYHIYSVTAGDLDNDGDQDLVVGHAGTQIPDYYRNDGTPESYDFTYAGHLSLPRWEFHSGYDALLSDIDLDADLDLLIGEMRYSNGIPLRLIFYRNDGTAEAPSWTFITDDFQKVVEEHRSGSISPCLADVDKDGDKDLVITNNSIGIQLFLNPLDPTGTEENIGRNAEIGSLPETSEYPNPFNDRINLSMNLRYSGEVSIAIYNILGRQVKIIEKGYLNKGKHKYQFSADDLSSGIYFVRYGQSEQQSIKKIILLK